MSRIETVEQLNELYGQPGAASLEKVARHVTAEYRTFIEAAPFAALATVAPEGIDCSPRGDQPGFVRVSDDGKTLMLPDRRGNNRVDSLSNIVRDPRVSLMFMVPGSGSIIRVNGQAHLSIDPALLDSFAVGGKPPRSVMVMEVVEIYFQCARAIVRSDIWNPDTHVVSKSLPTPGQILTSMTGGKVGGETYDAAWAGRAEKTLW
ncbi:MAG: pyridoxamine 5'-phosphate oxidase family protein [Rhodospirillales bacterium]|jgi:uncharacterized protein|nr:pyridoxamine 5'-phosphate oxidase family protein [Rhodospirillales bacterium]MBT4040838.1 pyridoxamine 5'-phosphate oxidase family protein [Rhodospirillales bacterium]MBT4625390.1 pyridoxamine 5'-phosphate oxidase family protein [Rhodospirillales bacterium]MBT5351927.1 pyridoxamine 5'-phosphate oxidase family protein [Rhodospirillales bacterium]MBT5521160.1 pyridoxamine 5'-phosphate oxidase family protein [Rhodospirillales bacterium]